MIITVIIRRQRAINPKKHNTVAHHPPANDLPVPKQQLVAPSQLPTAFILAMMFLGMECPSGQFPSAVLAMLPPLQFLVHFLSGRPWETEQSLT